VPLIGLAMLIGGAVEIGPAYAAAQGHGTLGYFTPSELNTCDQNSGCTLVGTFRSDNGRDIRNKVQLDGTWTGAGIGTKIPALDSADIGLVFPRTGTRHWQEDAFWLVLGTLIVAPWLRFVPIRRLWLRRSSVLRRLAYRF